LSKGLIPFALSFTEAYSAINDLLSFREPMPLIKNKVVMPIDLLVWLAQHICVLIYQPRLINEELEQAQRTIKLGPLLRKS
jgi:hypothetical protein